MDTNSNSNSNIDRLYLRRRRQPDAPTIAAADGLLDNQEEQYYHQEQEQEQQEHEQRRQISETHCDQGSSRSISSSFEPIPITLPQHATAAATAATVATAATAAVASIQDQSSLAVVALDELLMNDDNSSSRGLEGVLNFTNANYTIDDMPLGTRILEDGEHHTGGYTAALTIQIFVSSVAILLCITIILAMTLPLLDKRKRTAASTYNLYLVFLAIPDLVYNSFLVYLFSTFESWLGDHNHEEKGIDEMPLVNHPFDLALFVACATANLYTNAIISYEILKLLRNSKRRKRSKAPTLKRATSQAACTYSLGVVIFLLDYFAGDYFKTWPNWIIAPIYYGICIGLPILYLLWVLFRMYYERLLSNNAGRRLKVLVRYFARIIIVYVCIWLPASIMYMVQLFPSTNHHGLLYYIACFLYAIQVWVSFGLSMTKPDVRRNVYLLFRRMMCCSAPLDDNNNNNRTTTRFSSHGDCSSENENEKKKKKRKQKERRGTRGSEINNSSYNSREFSSVASGVNTYTNVNYEDDAGDSRIRTRPFLLFGSFSSLFRQNSSRRQNMVLSSRRSSENDLNSSMISKKRPPTGETEPSDSDLIYPSKSEPLFMTVSCEVLPDEKEKETVVVNDVFPSSPNINDNEECKQEIVSAEEDASEENSIRIGSSSSSSRSNNNNNNNGGDRGTATSSGRNHPSPAPNSSMNDNDNDNENDNDNDEHSHENSIKSSYTSSSKSMSPSESSPIATRQNSWIRDLRANIRDLGDQLKKAVTEEEKDLFRTSIASQQLVLASTQLLEPSSDLIVGESYSRNSNSNSHGNTVDNNNHNNNNNNSNNNNTQSVENRTNNAFVSSTLEVICDESSCEGYDDDDVDDDDEECNAEGE